jgi:hypothetical protein
MLWKKHFFNWKKEHIIIGLQSQPLDKINLYKHNSNLIPESQVNDVGQGFEWLNKQLQKKL